MKTTHLASPGPVFWGRSARSFASFVLVALCGVVGCAVVGPLSEWPASVQRILLIMQEVTRAASLIQQSRPKLP